MRATQTKIINRFMVRDKVTGKMKTNENDPIFEEALVRQKQKYLKDGALGAQLVQDLACCRL